jgi:hypothetical protein
MYMTLSQGSPWEKITSPRAYVTTRFPSPADSRNARASNEAAFFGAITSEVMRIAERRKGQRTSGLEGDFPP